MQRISDEYTGGPYGLNPLPIAGSQRAWWSKAPSRIKTSLCAVTSVFR